MRCDDTHTHIQLLSKLRCDATTLCNSMGDRRILHVGEKERASTIEKDVKEIYRA